MRGLRTGHEQCWNITATDTWARAATLQGLTQKPSTSSSLSRRDVRHQRSGSSLSRCAPTCMSASHTQWRPRAMRRAELTPSATSSRRCGHGGPSEERGPACRGYARSQLVTQEPARLPDSTCAARTKESDAALREGGPVKVSQKKRGAGHWTSTPGS